MRRIIAKNVHPSVGIVIEKTVEGALDVDRDDVVLSHWRIYGTERTSRTTFGIARCEHHAFRNLVTWRTMIIILNCGYGRE